MSAGSLDIFWTARVAEIKRRARQLLSHPGAWHEKDFEAELVGLERELVQAERYLEAVNLGRKTFPGVSRDDSDPVIGKWTDHIMQYAVDVPDRIAGKLVKAANEAEAADGATAQTVVNAIDAELEAMRSAVTRYAEPLWGAGQDGYSQQLVEHAVLMTWNLDSANPCPDCVALADGSPYEELPTEPGAGDTECLDRCRCYITADRDSFDAATAEGD